MKRRLSHSQADTAIYCEELWNLQHLQGIRPIFTSKPLRMGSIYAAAQDAEDAGVVADKYEPLIEAAFTEDEREELGIEQGVVGLLVEAYLSRYPDSTLAVEVPFEVEFEHSRFSGRFDKIVQGSADSFAAVKIGEDKLYAPGHKFMGADAMDLLDMSPQFVAYLAAVRQLEGKSIPGIPFDLPRVDELELRLTFKPKDRRKGRGQARTGRQEAAEYLAWFAEDLENNPSDYFATHRIKASEITTGKFARHIDALALQLDQAESSGLFRMQGLYAHPKRCTRFGEPCAMLPFCRGEITDASERPDLYTVRSQRAWS